MAVHELGTNAAKYGALSEATGRISVTWQILTRPGEDDEVQLIWDETSIPHETAKEASHRGFGNVVLQRIAPQSVSGRSSLEREPGHVRWVLVAPTRSVLVQPLEDNPEPVDFEL
jgi:two-component sensor histidine kinase